MDAAHYHGFGPAMDHLTDLGPPPSETDRIPIRPRIAVSSPAPRLRNLTNAIATPSSPEINNLKLPSSRREIYRTIPFRTNENAGFFGRGRRGGGRVGKPRGGPPWTAQRSHRKKRPCIRHTSCTSRYCSFGKRAQPRASTPTMLPSLYLYIARRPSLLFPPSPPLPSLSTIVALLPFSYILLCI